MTTQAVTTYDEAVDVRDGSWTVPDGWLQGRGSWGGLVVAGIVRAAAAADGRGLPLREVSVHMVGPLPSGHASVATTLVRQGSATSVWQVCVAGKETWAVGTVVFGGSRAAGFSPMVDLAMPPAPEWATCDVVAIGPPIAPEFLQHMALRPICGLPYSGGADPVMAWLAPTQPPVAYDAGLLVGLIDALWPASLVQATTPRPMATLSFSATLLVDPATVDPKVPLLHRGCLLDYVDGYATESRELWTADGRLAVHNTQVITVIK
ncbi:MAG: acyl-CoA thioesterase domain-containing protein [Candidatus Nanopelagicales bacterium]